MLELFFDCLDRSCIRDFVDAVLTSFPYPTQISNHNRNSKTVLDCRILPISIFRILYLHRLFVKSLWKEFFFLYLFIHPTQCVTILFWSDNNAGPIWLYRSIWPVLIDKMKRMATSRLLTTGSEWCSYNCFYAVVMTDIPMQILTDHDMTAICVSIEHPEIRWPILAMYFFTEIPFSVRVIMPYISLDVADKQALCIKNTSFRHTITFWSL